MVTKRKSISKKTRFEVFKRDGFKCQYCGAEAPKFVLNVDHIKPVADGGSNDMMNLITACFDCNSGKSDRALSDDSALSKQRAQLDELNERREQMEMMLEWRNAMLDMAGDEVLAVQKVFNKAIPGWHIRSESAVKAVKKYLKQYGLMKVLDAIELAANTYPKKDKDGAFIPESVELAWKKVGGILKISSLEPNKQRLHYIKGILVNRLSYVPYSVMRDLDAAHDAGLSVDDMELEAKNARSWTAFRNYLYEAIE